MIVHNHNPTKCDTKLPKNTPKVLRIVNKKDGKVKNDYGAEVIVYGPRQLSMMEIFETIVNGQKPLNLAAKLFILDVCRSPGYASAVNT